ncbi:hypothetical protein AB3Y40_01985 [Yoonia sp. R2331]
MTTTFLTVLLTPQTLNLAFAGLCLWAAFGLCPRRMAFLSALLYVALSFC